jgi:6-phosphofructokinase 2
LLEGYGLTPDLVWVDGETRLAHIIIETRYHRHSHLIAAGMTVSAAAYQELLQRYQAYLPQVAWVVIGGTLPQGVPVTCYRQLAQLAQAAGVSILIDSSGPPLREALPVYPTLLKMNWDEFSATFNVFPQTLDDLVAAARAERQRQHMPALVITCGAKGVVALTPAGDYLAVAPPQQAVNAAGAGDAVSATLVWRLSQGDTWAEALLRAAATGAAVTLTEGTAECRPADIERILPQTRVQPL